MKTNPFGKCIKLEVLDVETFTLNYKVFLLFGGLSKSVSPDEDRERILATYTINSANFIRAKIRVFSIEIKNDNRNIRVDTYMLIVLSVVPNKNK
jgi:hypothetical protein